MNALLVFCVRNIREWLMRKFDVCKRTIMPARFLGFAVHGVERDISVFMDRENADRLLAVGAKAATLLSATKRSARTLCIFVTSNKFRGSTSRILK